MVRAKAKSTLKKPIYHQIDGQRIAIINDDVYRDYPDVAYEQYKNLLVKEKPEPETKSETKTDTKSESKKTEEK
jgi:hypothetical protein